MSDFPEYLTSNEQIAYPFRENAAGLSDELGLVVHGPSAEIPRDFLLDAVIALPGAAGVGDLYLVKIQRLPVGWKFHVRSAANASILVFTLVTVPPARTPFRVSYGRAYGVFLPGPAFGDFLAGIGSAGAFRGHAIPVEPPNGILTTFTLPGGEAYQAGALQVFLNGNKYNPENILELPGNTQFTIFGGTVPAAVDRLSISYMIFDDDYFRGHHLPLEAPDGVRVTFTIPGGDVYQPGSLQVYNNGVKYNPESILELPGRTQFRIVADTIPAAVDRLSVSYLTGNEANFRGHITPVEAPNGVISTFTLPGGDVYKPTSLQVFLNGNKYNPESVVELAPYQQFTIVADTLPTAADRLSLSYLVDGEDNFGFTLPFEAGVVEQRPNRLDAILVGADVLTGDVGIRAGHNAAIQQANGDLLLSILPGAGLGQYDNCHDDDPHPPADYLCKLGGAIGNGHGDVQLIPGNCYRSLEDRGGHRIELANDCKACCSCQDYANVVVALGKTFELLGVLRDKQLALAADYNERVRIFNDITVPTHRTLYLSGTARTPIVLARAHISFFMANRCETDAWVELVSLDVGSLAILSRLINYGNVTSEGFPPTRIQLGRSAIFTVILGFAPDIKIEAASGEGVATLNIRWTPWPAAGQGGYPTGTPSPIGTPTPLSCTVRWPWVTGA